jgi:Zn-dependent protease
MKIVKKEEILVILGSILILALSASMRNLKLFFWTLLSFFIILIVNIGAKKITAYYLDAQLETRIWEVKNFIPRKNKETTKQFPLGAFLPIVSSLLTFGYITWLAPLTFEVKPKSSRVAKRVGLYNFSEMTEDHIAFIAAAGIIANLVLAFIGYFAGFENFALFNILFTFFNLIPISTLDGNKIFFGKQSLWIILSVITLILVAFSIILI